MSASIESRRKYIAFLLVCLFAACASIVCALFRGGLDHALDWILFGDFFSHIQFIRNEGAARLYFQHYNATFPPFIYIMYSFFDALLPKDISLLERSVPMLLYVWYCTICGALFTLLASAYSKKKSSSTTDYPPPGISQLLILSLLFSDIYFWGILQRGNSAVIACMLLLAAMILRQKESKVSQELALICIAAASAVKIYPAVFGLLYLRERRFKEALRLTLYGLVLFFFPFIFFGGVPAFIQLLKNLADVASNYYRDGESFIGIQSCCRFFWSRLVGTDIASAVEVLFLLISAAYFILAVTATCILTEEWKRLFMLTSIMVLCPSWSGTYTRIYFALPFIAFMFHTPASRSSVLYAILFAGIFSLSYFPDDMPVLGKLDSIILFLPIYAISISLGVETVAKLSKSQGQRRSKVLPKSPNSPRM